MDAADRASVATEHGEQVTAARAAMLLASIVASDPGTTILAIRGQCMEPLFGDGDRVGVAALTTRARIGQVLVALTPGSEVVCHRLIRRADDGTLLLAGDRGGRVDEVEPSQVLGVVQTVVRGGLELRLDHGVGSFIDRVVALLRHASWRMSAVRPRVLRAPRRPTEWFTRALVNLRARGLRR